MNFDTYDGLLRQGDGSTTDISNNNNDTNDNNSPVLPSYRAGETFTINITLTVHHMGHFEFSLCPLPPRDNTTVATDHVARMPWSTKDWSITPSQDCLRTHKLEIVKDHLFGAPVDLQYPERAMIPLPPSTGSGGIMNYSYEVRLPPPEDTSNGPHVLKWMYVSANSCYPRGYDQYPIPSSWNFQ